LTRSMTTRCCAIIGRLQRPETRRQNLELKCGRSRYNVSQVARAEAGDAVGLFRKAAGAGTPPRWTYLGHMYRGGYGVAQDNAEAARLLFVCGGRVHREICKPSRCGQRT
jgi:hypothetical protein